VIYCGKKLKNQFALNGHKKMKDDDAHRTWRGKNIDPKNQQGFWK
jgi:hypothetical protein